MNKQAPKDHPALPGHFPNNPLIPGVVLLDWAWQAALATLPAGTQLAGISHAKFLAPVRPGDQLQFQFSAPDETGKLSFTITLAERQQVAAQGSFKIGQRA